MKVRVTQKDVVSNYIHVLSAGYCDLYWLLHCTEPNFYTRGVYGWNADVYDIGNGIAIVTGYRPFGNIKGDYTDLTRKYEEKAKRVRDNQNINYTKRSQKLKKLIDEYAKEVILRQVLGTNKETTGKIRDRKTSLKASQELTI